MKSGGGRRKRTPYNPFAADIWSLGVTMYQAIAKWMPFNGNNVEEYKKNVQDEDIDFVPLPSNCPALFQDLISKMLVYNEDERISAKEVLEILGGELE